MRGARNAFRRVKKFVAIALASFATFSAALAEERKYHTGEEALMWLGEQSGATESPVSAVRRNGSSGFFSRPLVWVARQHYDPRPGSGLPNALAFSALSVWILDRHSTDRALARGHRESSPVFRRLPTGGKWAVSFGIVTGKNAILRLGWRSKHPVVKVLASGVVAGLTLRQALAARDNYRLTKR